LSSRERLSTVQLCGPVSAPPFHAVLSVCV